METLTPTQYRLRVIGGPKKAWHQQTRREGRKAPELDGMKFDSRAEMQRWAALAQQQLAGQIRNLQRQVRHNLVLADGTRIMVGARCAVYTSDFEYDLPDGTHIVEDYKDFYDGPSKFRIAVFSAISGQQVLMTGGGAARQAARSAKRSAIEKAKRKAGRK